MNHGTSWRFNPAFPILFVCLLAVGSGTARADDDDEHGSHGNASAARQLPPPADHAVSFTNDIRPLFVANCFECHAKGKHKGGFRVDPPASLMKGGEDGPIIVVGNSARSALIKMVAGVGVEHEKIMPPKGNDRLTAEEIGLLRAWIDQGAKIDQPKVVPAQATK